MNSFAHRKTVLVLLPGLLGLLLAGCDRPGTSGLGSSAELNLGKGQYTIMLDTQFGPSSFAKMQTYRQILLKNTGWPESDLLLVHNEEEETATLYYGTFDSFDRAVDRLVELRKIKTPIGKEPFANDLVQVVPAPGSQMGPKDWDLENTRGTYTLCVGKWYNMPEKDFYLRREYAILHCKELREKGYEAYYYHGDIESIVTVGLFGPEAVKVVKGSDGSQQTLFADPELRRLQRDGDTSRFLENGWIRKDIHVLRDSQGRARRDAAGQMIKQKTLARSVLVQHPKSKDAEPKTVRKGDENEPSAVLDSGFPKPW